MASGVIGLNVHVRQWGNGFSSRIVWSSTPNTLTNTSTVHCSLQYYKSEPTTVTEGDFTFYITVNGTRYSSSYHWASPYGTMDWTELYSVDVTVGHNDDGSKSITIGGGNDVSSTDGLYYTDGSGTAVLDTIPRKSDLSVSSTSITADGTSSITVSVNKKTSAFSDTATFALGSLSQSITLTGSGTSYSGTLTVPESWAQQFTTATSKTGTLTLTTTSGNQTIGTTTQNITVNVKSYTPSVSAVLSAVDTPSIFSSAGYVQSMSKVRVVTTASGYQGSTISSYAVTCENIAYSGADITSDILNNSGSQSVIVTVTDSRGITNTATYTITVVKYNAPMVSVSAQASSAENKSIITAVFNVSEVNNLNAKTYILHGVWTDSTGTTHDTDLTSGTLTAYSGTLTLYHNSIDPTITYKYSVKIQDSVGYAIDTAETGIVCISRRAGGKGVRFFADAVRDGIDLNSKLYHLYTNTKEGISKTFLDLFYPIGTIYQTLDADFNPANVWGGTWELITDRFLLGASSTYAAGSTGGVAEQKLSAAIGSGHGDAYSIAFVADSSSSYENAHGATYKVSGSSYTSGGSFSHSTPVTVHDSTDRNVSNMPPYLAVYIWKRVDDDHTAVVDKAVVDIAIVAADD